jgi:hypothetical protein
LGFGSGMDYETCVIHLCTYNRVSGLGQGSPWRGAELRSGASPMRMFMPCWEGRVQKAQRVSVEQGQARAVLTRVRGMLLQVRHGELRLCGGGAPVVWRSSTRNGLRLSCLAQKNKGGSGVLTAVRDRVVWLCREADVDGGRRCRNGVRGEGAAAVLQSSVPPRKVCCRAVNTDWRSVRHGDHRRRGIDRGWIHLRWRIQDQFRCWGG